MTRLPHATRVVRRRRYRVPPPVATAGQPAGLREARVLEENQNPFGVVLWRTLRSVQLWNETPPADRGAIFAEGAHESRLAEILSTEVPEALHGNLASLARMLSAPAGLRPDEVARACMGVASWARGAEKRGTALAFLKAAAHCCPFNPSLSLMAGREARDQAQHAQAESWLGRAIAVARQVEDWDAYSRSHVAVATMLLNRGALPTARRHLLKAERRARRHGLREARGMALHDLFIISSSMEAADDALRYAREALGCYRPANRRLVYLAFDLAFFWMKQGHFDTALSVFPRLLPLVEPGFRPHVQGAIARAAGACSRAVEHRHAVRALDALPVGPGVAEAWLDAAHGAVSLSQWDEAASHAERALRTATGRREHRVEHLAEQLLLSVQQRRRPAASPPEAEPQPAVEELAFELVGTLERIPVGSAA